MKFVIDMECVVRKFVTVECASEEEARENPWDHAVDEIETEQIDWINC